MSDQFNIYADDPGTLEAARKLLEAAFVDRPDRPMFFVDAAPGAVTASVHFHDDVTEDSTCTFPGTPAGTSYRYGDLIYTTGLVKSGCHHPVGMMVLYGPGIRKGVELGPCDNLDVAPTLLTLLGLPVPQALKGRILDEAFVAGAVSLPGPRAA